MKAEALYKVKLKSIEEDFNKISPDQTISDKYCKAIIFAACIIAEAIRNSVMDESQ